MTLPYATARSGMKAREEIQKVLQRFGAESVGFMDEFNTKTVILAFVLRGQPVQLRASAQGWANTYLKENPWTSKRYLEKRDYEQKALDQGMVAVNSILRDWVKGQVTAIETGVLTFEHVFMPYMLASDGRPLIEHVQQFLPAPDPQGDTHHHENHRNGIARLAGGTENDATPISAEGRRVPPISEPNRKE